MNFQVLVSTMFLDKNDLNSFILKMNLKSHAVIVNQCDLNEVIDYEFNDNKVKLINTSTRGLSISRNIALKNAEAKICLICDDDEYLDDNIENIILTSFKNYNADLLSFKVHNLKKKEYNKITKFSFSDIFSVCSVQIAFKRESIINNNILFDESVGAGVSLGGGEENLFIKDCLKHKLIIKKIPAYIATLLPSISTWRLGYNENFFRDKGTLFRKLFPLPFAYIYMNYFYFSKLKKFSKDINFLKGYFILNQSFFSYQSNKK